METPVDIDLLSRVAVQLFVHEPRTESWMTACLVGPDAALTTAELAGSDAQQIELRIHGESRAAKIELVDEAAGFALLRFSPPTTADLPRVFSTREPTVAREASFLTLANLGYDHPLQPLYGIVLDTVTRDGKRFHLVEVSPVAPIRGIAGAPVVIDGRVLGLIAGGEMPGRDERRSTLLVAPFSALQGTALEHRLSTLSATDRADEAAVVGDHPAGRAAAPSPDGPPTPPPDEAPPPPPRNLSPEGVADEVSRIVRETVGDNAPDPLAALRGWVAAGKPPGDAADSTPAADASPPSRAAAAGIATALAGFRSDGVSDQDDLLDIEHDVSALCSVIAARDVEPPLSIGLFGDWGSGKSFFLDAMQAQLERIAKAADQAEQDAIANGKPIKDATRYCARITQLEFNAWHYIDTELWASLADGIIDGLAKALDRPTLDPSSATERARLLAATAHSRDVIAEAEAEKHVAESNLRDQEQVLQQALARAQAPRRGAAAVRQQARVLAIAASPVLGAELAKVTKQLGASAPTTEAKAALLDLQGLGGTTRAVWRAIRASSAAAVVGIAVLAALVLGIAVLHDQFDAAVRAVVGAAGVAGAITTWFTAFRPYVQRAHSAVGAVKQIIDKHAAALETARQEATEQERRRREQAAAAVEAARLRLTEARRELDKIETQLIALRADQQMATFVKERQASDDYRKHLGVIARARSDFERLSDLLFRTRDDAPRQGLPRIDRIVLYIDDLDRCDEEQVVKVLQAVHLLLAFKLFVVVVAVDSRWLLHSLQQHSRAFQADLGGDDGLSEDERLHWQSTPLNYLEKIFQIPFTLRPMGSAGFGNMIDHLTAERAETSAADAPRTTPGEIVPATLGAATATGVAARPATEATAAPTEPAATATAAAPAAGTGAAPGAVPASPPTATVGTGGTAAPTGPSQRTAPAAAPGRPAGRPRLADTPVDVVPPHLLIEPWEQAFMKQFHDVISTPRAVKRFVNVYRLLKARVPDDRAAAFRGDAGGGEHRAAIFLLALLIGYPSEATDLMRDLTESPVHGDWWTWLVGAVGGEQAAAAAKSAQRERWTELAARLAVIQRRFTELALALPSVEAFGFWTPYVSRFSFQAGRISATVAPPAPAEKPPARKARTAAGSGKPRDRSEAG